MRRGDNVVRRTIFMGIASVVRGVIALTSLLQGQPIGCQLKLTSLAAHANAS
jgi:hypothetical protein